MSPAELLSKLRTLRIGVRADNGRLVCDAPQGALTVELRAALSEQKAGILALLVREGAARPQPPLRRLPRDGDLPISFAQRRLWFIDQLEPGSSLYNVSKAFRIRGALDQAVLERSLDEVVRRHEVLRTTFLSIGGRPMQTISSILKVSLPVVDASDCPDGGREGDALRLIEEEAWRPFELARGPLLRALLVRLTSHDHVLLLTLHHIVSDGWSMGILYRELGALYEAYRHGRSSPLAELPVQYADFAQWQREWLRGDVLQSQVDYWKERLTNLAVLQLPLDRPRSRVQSHRGARQSMALSDSLCQALNVLSQKERASLFMTLLAAFNVLLCRYSGQQDIAVATPIAGRNRTEIEGLIGFFVNTLVLRNDLSGDPTFRELLGRVRDRALDAYGHQDLPFEKLVEELAPERQLGVAPLSQVMFAFQNFPEAPLEISGCSLEPIDLDSGTAKFDLIFQVYRQPQGMRCLLTYDTDLFDQNTPARMLGHFQTLLEGIVADPNRRIAALPILTAAERRQLLVEWNDTEREYPKDKCVHELFEEQADRTPDAVAVVCEDERLSYRELNGRANQLANCLRRQGAGPEVLVGLYMERSLEMIVGLLAVLKAGGAYVPLDPEYPTERLDFLLDDARPGFVLTRRELAGGLHSHKAAVLCLDAGPEMFERESLVNPRGAIVLGAPAYVIYTSGSTGKPKGVVVEHRQLLNYTIEIIRRLPIEGAYSFAMVQPLMFDSSLTMIFPALLTGGSLHVVSRERAANPGALDEYFRRYGIDFLKITPSHLAALRAANVGNTIMPRRCLITGGEESRWDWARSLQKFNSECRIINHYGPTETTVGVLTCRIEDIQGARHISKTPLGRPIGNTQIFLLDPELQPVPIGISGELFIGGDSVTRGYLNQPTLTAERYLPDPFSGRPGSRLYRTGDVARYLPDGNIEFIGRIDEQLKIRGFRVEPGEIETVLKEHPDVREAVVIARDDDAGQKRLIGYVVAVPERAPTIGGKPRYKLPNGMAVAQLNKNETDYLYQEIFERQAYVRHGITIEDGDCVFDVGANIGLFMLFADRIANNLKIYSFEPNPAVFEILSANASLCKADVKVFGCGLSDVSKTAVFTFFPGFSLLSGFYADAQNEKAVVKTYMANQQRTGLVEIGELLHEAEEILDERFTPQLSTAQLRSLSAVIEAEAIGSIDLLKINVEKSELDVLNGIKDGDWAKIKQIVLEVDSEENVAAVIPLLEHHGFECVVEQESALSGTSLRYVYAVRPAKARSRRNSAPRLVSAGREDRLLSSSALKLWAGEKLPDYMVPSGFVFLDALPLTPNGKLDRRSLPAPDSTVGERKDSYVAPRTGTEERLAEIWAGVLSAKEIGIHDDFFELGGHSLLAIQLISRIRDAFRIELPLRTLFERPTVAGLGEQIETLNWAVAKYQASGAGKAEEREEIKL